MSSFQFVNNSNIDGKARKLIRSHVMRGRNLGKTRTPRRKDISPTVDDQSTSTQVSERDHEEKRVPLSTEQHAQREKSLIAVSRQLIGGSGIGSTFAKNIAPQTLSHLYQMTSHIVQTIAPPEFCNYTGASERFWFQQTNCNEAYFHCLVAMSSACAAFLTGNSSHSAVALHHMSQTYRLIHQKLSSNEALADGTIAVVVSTTVYDRLYGDPQRAMIHFNGVSNMIALRGGMRDFAKHKFYIAEKTLRSDIEFALHFNSAPMFTSRDIPRHLILVDTGDLPAPQRLRHSHLLESVLYQSVCEELRDVVLDILYFSQMLKEQETCAQRLDPDAYNGTIIYLSYRLIEMKLLDDNHIADSGFNTLIHLAMIGFQITFCHSLGSKLISFSSLTRRFRSTAQTIWEDKKPRQLAVLWALIMGRIALLTSADDVWLVPRMKLFADNLGLHTWSDMSGALDSFPWIKATHDARGALFWRTALLARSPPTIPPSTSQ